MTRRSLKAVSARSWPAVLVMAIAAGCGGDGSSGEAVEMPATEACALLGTDDVVAVLGDDVGAGEAGIPADAQSEGAPAVECRWATPDGARTLTVVLHRAMTVGDAEAALSAVRESFASAGPAPAQIDSIGDDAFFAFNQLHVRSGSDYLTIVVSGFAYDAAQTAASNAAVHALPRLTVLPRE